MWRFSFSQTFIFYFLNIINTVDFFTLEQFSTSPHRFPINIQVRFSPNSYIRIYIDSTQSHPKAFTHLYACSNPILTYSQIQNGLPSRILNTHRTFPFKKFHRSDVMIHPLVVIFYETILIVIRFIEFQFRVALKKFVWYKISLKFYSSLSKSHSRELSTRNDCNKKISFYLSQSRYRNWISCVSRKFSLIIELLLKVQVDEKNEQ